MKYVLLILPRKPATALVKPLPPGTPSRSNQARALCHRVLLEWGQGKVALKFTTSEEMLPLSSSSQSRVSLCEVYTRMMHFIWSLWKVEGGRTERLFAVPRRNTTSSRTLSRQSASYRPDVSLNKQQVSLCNNNQT